MQFCNFFSKTPVVFMTIFCHYIVHKKNHYYFFKSAFLDLEMSTTRAMKRSRGKGYPETVSKLHTACLVNQSNLLCQMFLWGTYAGQSPEARFGLWWRVG